MVEITDKPPLSIGRELDVIVLQEVRASSRPYIGLHVPRESQDNPRTLFSDPEKLDIVRPKPCRIQVIVPLKNSSGQQ